MKKKNLKFLPLLFSSMAVQVASDPVDFAFKAQERLRQRGILKTQLIDSNSAAASLIDKARLEGENARGLAKLVWRMEKSRLDLDFPQRKHDVLKPGQWKLSVNHYLTNSFPHSTAGYAERSHKNLRAQVMSGIKVKAFTRGSYPLDVGIIPSAFKDVIEGVQYYRILPPVYFPLQAMRDEFTVRMLISNAKKAHILHTTTGFHNAHIVARAAEKLGVPWVYEVRGEPESTWVSKFSGQDKVRAQSSEYVEICRSKETEAALAADHVVVLSEISKNDFIARGVPASKITVIPNGVDEEFLDKDFDQLSIRKELSLPTDCKLVGTVTSVVPYEGLETLIEALPMLDGYKALIVGDGVSLPNLKQRAKELNVLDKVIFAGRQPNADIWKWYASLDVFVVPRIDVEVCRKITPLKALVAQAIGIPVVASELPALKEVTGGLASYCEPGSPSSLAIEITKAGRLDLRTAATDWANSRTWESNGKRFLNLYIGLLNKKRES